VTTRPLDQIRSDLRGAIALAPSVDPRHRERFSALLAEAKACTSPDQWTAMLRELSISDALLANYLKESLE
jgi:hypothetical protein